MKVEEAFKLNLKDKKASCYFIACSGGIDSMALLHLAEQLMLKIHVLHVNYNLRGNDSRKDSILIENYCLKKNIPFSIISVNLKQQLILEGGNLQNEARKIRYDFFKEKLNSVKKSKLLVAHHLDDQIETFWLQLFRGSGLKGMAGMNFENNQILRPLLNVKKSDLIQYAEENNLTWREDASNAKIDYERNKWRNEFLPFLRKEIFEIDESVSALQNVFSQNLELIQSQIAEITAEINANKYIGLIKFKKLKSVDYVELFRALEIPRNQIIPFIKLFSSQKGIRIRWKDENQKEREIIREQGGFYFNLYDDNFRIPELKIEQVTDFPEKFDKQTFYFSQNKINGAIYIRLWKKGDRIYPIGLAGSKLISDVITDAKVPNWKRKLQLVICDQTKILACLDHCIDRRAISGDFPIIKVSLKN